MPARLIAIGDIHGCSTALRTLLDAIDPHPEDTIVTLGDYVDRGPDSRGVLDRLLALDQCCRLVPLLGNHDLMLLDAHSSPYNDQRDHPSFQLWLECGGVETLDSYGVGATPSAVAPEHISFLQRCRLHFEADTHIFVHANYRADVPMNCQSSLVMLWDSLRQMIPGPHCSGKTVIVGHTSQKSGEILDLGYLRCIDTYCYGGGWLTALDVYSGQYWQASQKGKLRG